MAVNRALGPIIYTACAGLAHTRVNKHGIAKNDGFAMWRELIAHYSARSDIDGINLRAAITRPTKARDLDDLATRIGEWDKMLEEYHVKFPHKSLDDDSLISGLLSLMPKEVITKEFQGKRHLLFDHEQVR